MLGTMASVVTPAGPAAAAVPGGMTQASSTSAFDSAQSKSAVATCPANQYVIGTGSNIFNGGGQVSVEAVIPDVGLTTVTVTAKETDTYTSNWEVTAYAQCAPLLPGLVRVMTNGPASSASPQTVIASCPGGTTALGIGYDVGNGFGEVLVNQVVPNGGIGVAADQVTVTAHEDGVYAANWTLIAYLVCATAIAGQEVVSATTAASSVSPQAVNATCAFGMDMTGGSVEVNATAAADESELSVDAALPFSLGGVRTDNSQAIAYEEDAIAGNWTVTSYALCT
jgi:hypothetical protein